MKIFSAEFSSDSNKNLLKLPWKLQDFTIFHLFLTYTTYRLYLILNFMKPRDYFNTGLASLRLNIRPLFRLGILNSIHSLHH